MIDFSDNFKILSEQIFEVCGLKWSEPELDHESSEYQACTFRINNRTVRYRHAKVTPTKNGQFVTLWKRISKKPIQPYDSSDDIDLFLVTINSKNKYGQFVFPKSVLIKQGVLSVKGKGGKRAIRVYPPWDKAESKQAQKTQDWQLDFFSKLPKNNSIEIQKIRSLYLA